MTRRSPPGSSGPAKPRQMDPDWLGSPQHFAATVVVAGALAFLVGRRTNCPWWIAAGLGLGAAASAEVAYELIEYPLRYADEVHLTAYEDTLADLASSLAGGVAGGLIGAWFAYRD
jgi:hypothetical protein